MKTFKQKQLEKYKDNYPLYIFWKDKFDLMNSEDLWLNSQNESSVSFVCNSNSYDRLYKNIKGIRKVVKKIFKNTDLQMVYIGDLFFKRK